MKKLITEGVKIILTPADLEEAVIEHVRRSGLAAVPDDKGSRRVEMTPNGMIILSITTSTTDPEPELERRAADRVELEQVEQEAEAAEKH